MSTKYLEKSTLGLHERNKSKQQLASFSQPATGRHSPANAENQANSPKTNDVKK